ncbi:MAG: polysaccharide pyruvyl transferase CsaB [Clostridiales bacterium]|nr:polysaccharide pyruvyl transferase CsaB [Clostridiales bacterium]
MKAPRLLLHGYYGFGNAGDEALLYALLKDLREEAPEAELKVLSGNPEHTRRSFGVPAVDRFHPLEVIRALRWADLYILGGGTLLQDVTSLRSLHYYAGVLLLARLLGTPSMLYANGLGPIETAWGRWITRHILRLPHLITLRDHQSLDFMEGLKVRRPALVTADAALGLTLSLTPEEEERRLKAFGLEPESYALLALRPPARGKSLPPALVELIATIAREEPYEPIFLPFHPRLDQPLAEDLLRQVKPRGRILQVEAADTPSFLLLLKRAGLILTMRLHALIMSAAVGRGALAVVYDPKVEGVAEDLGLPTLGKLEELPPMPELWAHYLALKEEISRREEALRRDLPDLRAKAKSNAQRALELWKTLQAK